MVYSHSIRSGRSKRNNSWKRTSQKSSKTMHWKWTRHWASMRMRSTWCLMRFWWRCCRVWRWLRKRLSISCRSWVPTVLTSTTWTTKKFLKFSKKSKILLKLVSIWTRMINFKKTRDFSNHRDFPRNSLLVVSAFSNETSSSIYISNLHWMRPMRVDDLLFDYSYVQVRLYVDTFLWMFDSIANFSFSSL